MSQFLLAEIVANPFNTIRIFDYTNIGWHTYVFYGINKRFLNGIICVLSVTKGSNGYLQNIASILYVFIALVRYQSFVKKKKILRL